MLHNKTTRKLRCTLHCCLPTCSESNARSVTRGPQTYALHDSFSFTLKLSAVLINCSFLIFFGPLRSVRMKPVPVQEPVPFRLQGRSNTTCQKWSTSQQLSCKKCLRLINCLSLKIKVQEELCELTENWKTRKLMTLIIVHLFSLPSS